MNYVTNYIIVSKKNTATASFKKNTTNEKVNAQTKQKRSWRCDVAIL